MLNRLTVLAGASALSGCLSAVTTTVVPNEALRLSATRTCEANFGLSSADTLTTDQSLQLNGCIAQALADTSVASGGLVPLEPLAPVDNVVETTAVVVPTPAGCVANGGVFQGGVGYCVGQMR
jgi:hypothetical protein